MESKGYLPREQLEILSCMAAFAVVVESGSFVDASVRLGVTPSAVSKQVSKLESVLSLRLLERTTRQLKVNAEGVEVYTHCRDLLNSSQRVFHLKDRYLEEPQGLVRVAVAHPLFNACNNLVPGFLEKYQNINVKLVAFDGVCNLIADDFDVAVMVTDSPPQGQVARKLHNVNYEVYASKSYVAKHGFPDHPLELKHHCCIAFPDSLENQLWRFQGADAECEVRVSSRYSPGSLEGVLNATIAGLGFSRLPDNIISKDSGSSGLVRVFPEWSYKGVPQGMAWVVHHPGRHVLPRVKYMVAYLVEHLRDLKSFNSFSVH